MRQVTLRERGRIHRIREGGVAPEDNVDACYLEARTFDRLMAYDRSRQDKPIFNWGVDRAQVRQWVGVIQLPGLLLELLPKIDGDEPGVGLARDNLLVMLAEAGAVPVRSRDLADLDARSAPLHETLVALYAKSLRAELLRGLDRGYIAQEEDLRVLRGKLIIGRHIARKTARRERFSCAYDEFTADTELNRLLKASCRALTNLARSKGAREALSHCLLMLDDVADEHDVRGLLKRVRLTRQNERFSKAFEFCRLLFEQLAPNARAGERRVHSLLFDMDRIFEGFIAALIMRAARDAGGEFRVFPQAKARRRYLMEGEGGGGILNLRPDILIERSDGELIIIDTKWKSLRGRSAQARIAAADLYQLYAYTRRFDASRSILLLPRVPGVAERDFAPLDGRGEADGSRVELRFVDVQRNLGKRGGLSQLRHDLSATLLPK